MLTGFSAESEKNLWLGNFLNLKLNTRLPRKKIQKLDVDAFREEGKRFKSQIHLIIISRDCQGPVGSNMICVHLLPQAEFEFKDLRWSETKNLKISIPDNIFFLSVIIIKLCTLKQLENVHQKLKLKFL